MGTNSRRLEEEREMNSEKVSKWISVIIIICILILALSGAWSSLQYWMSRGVTDTAADRINRATQCIELGFNNLMCVNNLPTDEQLEGLRLCMAGENLSHDECSSIVYQVQIVPPQ